MKTVVRGSKGRKESRQAQVVTREYVIIILFILLFIRCSNTIVAQSAQASDITLVPTFESVGIYWSPSDGSVDNECRVRYRAVGDIGWSEALPLWFDARNGEYRGSIVHVQPDTSYEVQLTLQGTGTTAIGNFSTWSEGFPIAQTIELPSISNEALVISQSGAPGGRILYTSPAGGESVIDVANQHDYTIEVRASYIIIRALVLRGARIHGIRIYPNSHDVIIEECDISNWGRIASNGFGEAYDAAIYAREPEGDATINRLIIQRNRLHHPRADANNWQEPLPDTHPRGPRAITLLDIGTNHVIRYNEIYSDDDHYFEDCVGGWRNWSYTGFPNADTDVYGNIVSHCWDDGIEAEGGNRNVRIWGNYIDRTYVKIAIAGTSVGPLYIWRNVGNVCAQTPDSYRGILLKAGGKIVDEVDYSGGQIYVFHNTLLQPAGQGCNGGLADWGGFMSYLQSRNNILQVSRSTSDSIHDHDRSPTNDFDYDLYNGEIIALAGSEAHGIRGVPIYEQGSLALVPSSPGYDAAVLIPNFNDNCVDAGPDMGAQEAGAPLLEFGVNAYPSPSFTLTASPSSRTIDPGEVANYTLSVVPIGGFTDTVNLVSYSQPSDLNFSFDPTSVVPPGQATLTITDTHPGPTLVPGLWYTIPITGTGGGFTRTTSVGLLVGGTRTHLPLILRNY